MKILGLGLVTAAMNAQFPRSWLSLPLLIAGAGCASESTYGLVLVPATRAGLQVDGSNPFVRVDNDGPGAIDVQFAPRRGPADTVRITNGSAARNLRGGGELQFQLVDGEQASVQVLVQGATGAALVRDDSPPAR